MVSGIPSAVLSQSTIPVNSGAGPQSARTAGSFSHSSKDIGPAAELSMTWASVFNAPRALRAVSLSSNLCWIAAT